MARFGSTKPNGRIVLVDRRGDGSFWRALHQRNFTQNILLGLPNSGNVVPFSIFKLEGAADSLVYNVGFGI